MKTLKEIAKEYLQEHCFVGLCKDACGCGLDDFMPCDDPSCDCVPAVRVIVTEENYSEYWGDADIGDTIYVPAPENVNGCDAFDHNSADCQKCGCGEQACDKTTEQLTSKEG